MKKIILLILMLLAASCAFGMQLINLSGNYYQPYGDLGGKNYLSWHAWRLEKTHGINVVIFNETKEEKTDPKAKASEYLPLAIKNKEDKAISIYLNKYMRRGAIAISENLTGIMPPEYIEYLEEDLIRRMMWRWYTSDTKVLGKVLGAFIYNLEKNTLSKDDLRRQKDGIINIDDNVYLFSKKQPFNDIIKLFFAEPISFMFYFPLITFFLMVRVVYLIWGEKAGKIMRTVWVLFMLMILLLIIKRLDVFYAEYLWTFNLFTALMFPFYIYLAVMYKEQIVIMAQNYAEKITGFNGINAFEGEKWPK